MFPRAALLPPFGVGGEDDLDFVGDVMSLPSSSLPSSVPSSLLTDTPPDTESDREEREEEDEEEEGTSDPATDAEKDVSELLSYTADDESTDDGTPTRRRRCRKCGLGRLTFAAAMLALLTSWVQQRMGRGGEGGRFVASPISRSLVLFGAPTVHVDCARVIHLRIKPKLVRRFPAATSRKQTLRNEKLLLNAAITHTEGTGATTLRLPVTLPQLILTIVPFLVSSAAQDAKGQVVRIAGRVVRLLRDIVRAVKTGAMRAWCRLWSRM